VNLTSTSNSYSDNLPLSQRLDVDKPLSFKSWKANYPTIIQSQELVQYNDYLINWYKNKESNKIDTRLETRLNFLQLLKQLQIFFTKEEAENWYNSVDLDNEKELLIAIPYFAKKLKDVSLYYLELRNEIKKTKIKYNLIGSETSVIQSLQELFLKQFTKKTDKSFVVPNNIWQNIPALSSISEDLSVEIEELYDYQNYFDRSLNLPISAYFSYNSNYAEKYFADKGISLDSIDWIYRLGQYSLSSVITETPELTGLFEDLAKKYLGSDKYSTYFVQSSAKKDFYTINIDSGNNFFYWPAGVYKSTVKNLPIYEPVLLKDTDLQNKATPGTSIEDADTIFVKTKTGITGAWFRRKEFDTTQAVMQARIGASDKTIFRYPFPGFGISAEDIPWTGYSLVTDPRFFYLNDSIKQNIEQIYWNTSFELSGTEPLFLNDTTLIDSGAYPSSNYTLADKIRFWSETPPYNLQNYSGPVNEAWLYKFSETSIAVAPSEESIIQWPVGRVKNTLEQREVPTIPSNLCLPESLSSVKFKFSTASNNITSADIVYRVLNYKDTISQAVECAWLSGTSYSYPDIQTTGIKQTSFSALFQPGTYTRFIWDSTDQINVNNVFKGSSNHLPDCKFVTTPNTTYKDFSLCTCKQVLFSPFGHPGDFYTDNNELADFIVEDTNVNESFDFNTWRDSQGRSFNNSSQACWFRTNNKIEWGNGRWISNSNEFANEFYLRRGKRYIYFRANVKNIPRNILQLPYYVIRYEQPVAETSKQVWVQAVRDEINGTWVSTNKPSSMTLYSGDFIIYSRKGSLSFSVSGVQTQEVRINENLVTTNDKVNVGSLWSNYNYVTINNNEFPVIVNYPVSVPVSPQSYSIEYQKQIPIHFTNIRRILAWKITDPLNNNTIYERVPFLQFVPTLTGIYTISLTALTGSDISENCYYFTNIPSITAISQSAQIPTLSTLNLPLPGFVINTPLRGWDYSTNTRLDSDITFEPGNAGAAPFWAKTNLIKDELTDFKGIESWGEPLQYVDEHNPIIQPQFFNVPLQGGEYFEYIRNFPAPLIWSQPLTLKNTVNQNEWCTLEFDQQIPLFLNNFDRKDLITIPTTKPSTLTLQNFIDNESVEVYYNAIRPFTWSITAVPILQEQTITTAITSESVTSLQPWVNLLNSYNPSVAFFPSLNALSSIRDTGGYFIPKNLGISTYINRDYTLTEPSTGISTLEFFENPIQKIQSRGLTKEFQISPFKILQENNIWLKEPYTTGAITGTIKNEIYKKYQKFIPYQSSYETNFNLKTGLITPTSRQTPWGGYQDIEWSDTNNFPISFTGELNVNAWADQQILKKNSLYLDCWVTDIFGNQYGLYKDIRNLPATKRNLIGGEIWTRKNSQLVEPASISLKNIFTPYSNISLYNDLTGHNVLKIDMFYDTLYIETSTAVLFEKIKYDYLKDTFNSNFDFSRQISLAIPSTNNLNRELNFELTNPVYSLVGETWFSPKEKNIYVTVIELSSGYITPKLYKYQLQNQNLTQVFPISNEDKDSLIQLVGLNAHKISKPVITYHETQRSFVYSFTTTNNNNQDTIVELHIKNTGSEPRLININIYVPELEALPPTISEALKFNVPLNSPFAKQLLTNSSTANFKPINFPSWARLSSNGRFVCQPRVIQGAARQVYNLEFEVSNFAGSAYYSLLINVI